MGWADFLVLKNIDLQRSDFHSILPKVCKFLWIFSPDGVTESTELLTLFSFMRAAGTWKGHTYWIDAAAPVDV